MTSEVKPKFDASSDSVGAAEPAPVPLSRLTAGRKELKIEHAGETYLLRVTKANKLILTKPQDAAPLPAGEACSPA